MSHGQRTGAPRAPSVRRPIAVLAIAGLAIASVQAIAATGTTVDASQGCRDSRDPRCADFRWAPRPSTNEPATVELLSIDQEQLPDGSWEVTFRFQVSDPDAALVCRSDDLGDGLSTICDPWWAVADCEPGYGPWRPPSPRPSHEMQTISSIYDASGDYEVRFEWSTASIEGPDSAPGNALGSCRDPYANTASWASTVTVGGDQ